MRIEYIVGFLLCALLVWAMWTPIMNLYVLGQNAAQVTRAIQQLDQRQGKVEQFIRDQAQATPEVK